MPDQTSTSAEPLRTTKETHPNLPPGLILDAEGKVCKVCNSWQDWAKIGSKKTTTTSTSSNPTSSMADMFASSSTRKRPTTIPIIPTPVTAKDRNDCPADTAALGRSTWTFLHTTAAYYPLQASEKHQTNMRSLLSSLPVLYPCGWCAEDFGKDMKANPPDLSGREGLSKWLCERHNEVNSKLGKETFECTVKKLGERWKDGPEDGSCG